MSQRGEHTETETELVTVDGGGEVKASLPPVSNHFDIVGEEDVYINPELSGGLRALEKRFRYFFTANKEGAGNTLAGVWAIPEGASSQEPPAPPSSAKDGANGSTWRVALHPSACCCFSIAGEI